MSGGLTDPYGDGEQTKLSGREAQIVKARWGKRENSWMDMTENIRQGLGSEFYYFKPNLTSPRSGDSLQSGTLTLDTTFWKPKAWVIKCCN